MISDHFPLIHENIVEKLRQGLKAKGRRVDEESLQRKAAHPLYRSLYLLSLGELDCVVAGCCYTTKEVIKAGLEILGKSPKLNTISSSTLLIRDSEPQFKSSLCRLWCDNGAKSRAACEYC